MNLHEHIKKVLREEVNKKYLKPSEKSEKFILDRLNAMASGAEIYHVESYKTRHDLVASKDGETNIRWINYNSKVMESDKLGSIPDLDIANLLFTAYTLIISHIICVKSSVTLL